MNIIELLLIGIGLSMDAFAVAVCKGLSMKKINYNHMLLIALFFGGFQAIMPLIGWSVGKNFSGYIQKFDHWIAFVLLVLIGGKMIIDTIREKDQEVVEMEDKLDLKELTLLAIATSIDALAIGVTFAFLEVSIVPAVTMIGITTFVISVAGVFIGNVFGSQYKSKAQIVGGIILVLIGLKILVEHLNIFG